MSLKKPPATFAIVSAVASRMASAETTLYENLLPNARSLAWGLRGNPRKVDTVSSPPHTTRCVAHAESSALMV